MASCIRRLQKVICVDFEKHPLFGKHHLRNVMNFRDFYHFKNIFTMFLIVLGIEIVDSFLVSRRKYEV